MLYILDTFASTYVRSTCLQADEGAAAQPHRPPPTSTCTHTVGYAQPCPSHRLAIQRNKRKGALLASGA